MQKRTFPGECLAIHKKVFDRSEPIDSVFCQAIYRRHNNFDHEGTWNNDNAIQQNTLKRKYSSRPDTPRVIRKGGHIKRQVFEVNRAFCPIDSASYRQAKRLISDLDGYY